jgi:hypothetical protein
MSEKRKFKNGIVISLIVLLVVSIGLGWEIKKPEIISKKIQNYFSGEIDKFCINNICVQKNGSDWMATNGKTTAPANKEITETYVKRFGEIKLENIASINQSNFAGLGIGVNQVILEINGKKIEIGNINAYYDGTYIREPEGKTVFEVNTVFEKEHLNSFDQWVNRTLTNLATLQTSKITMSKNGKTKEFMPKNGQWDDSSWMDRAVHLTAINYLSGFTPGNEIKTSLEIETDKQKVNLTLGKSIVDKKNAIYWATTDEKYYYSISTDDYNLLTGKIN